MELSSRIDSVVADLRRAGSPGSLGDAPDRSPDVIVDPNVLADGSRFVPSANPLAVAIDGRGFFVLDDSGTRAYGRLGDFRVDERGSLVDSDGRAVIGFGIRADGTEAEAAPISVSSNGVASKRFSSFVIDEAGTLLGVMSRSPNLRWRGDRPAVPIARLALAMFQAPARLRRASETTVVPTSLSGIPELVAPGKAGAGVLRRHALAAGAIDVGADLRALWMLRRKGEFEATLASASDSCVRTALGLVR